ncbi:MAG: glycosyl hydrolase family 18 protein [Hungatella sp.]
MEKGRVLGAVIGTAAFALIVAGGYLLYQYYPSGQLADKGEILGVQGEEAAVFLNYELQDVKGIVREGTTYLPLTWVNQKLNEKFYWDEVEKMLVYTLPETIVYADKRTMGNHGTPLLLAEEDGVYLAAGLISNYTDVSMNIYSDEYNRVFVDNAWEDRVMASAKRKLKVREKGGVKSPIITEIEKGEQLQVLEEMENWSRVLTDNGYVGYVWNHALHEGQGIPQISMFEEPEYTSIQLDESVCLAWHQVMSKDANAALDSLLANTRGLNVIAPTWFALTDNQGNYESYADREYVQKAHDAGLQVWAVLDNFNKGENVKSEVLFSRTSVRKKLIGNLMEDVETYDLDGINLDVEGIKPEAGPHYVQFIRELSVACRNNGIILSVDNYVPTDYTSFYNRAEQGRVVDYVIVMGYDEHYAGGDAGSVASLPYVKKGIEDTAAVVPKEKIVNAIPFYTRVWTLNGDKTTSSALGISAAKKWVEENQVELYWQEELGQYYGELQTEEGLKQVWMEEEESIAKKMEVIGDADIAGVACWKLGFEPEEIWDIVSMEESLRE